MSFSLTVAIVVFIILIYYISMIFYDLYTAKLKKEESEEVHETPIDVSGQLDGFEPYNIYKEDESQVKRKSLVSWLCKGVSAMRMNQMMEDAANGTATADLNNVIVFCDKVNSNQ